MFKKQKLRIGVIGSTGSVGKTSLSIISKYENLFKVDLLVCGENYKLAKTQVEKYTPKYVYASNEKTYNYLKKKFLKKKIYFFNDFNLFKKSINLKFDKIILAIPGVEGLKFAFLFAEFSRELLIANKESIICGGKILLNYASGKKCKIKSIDSEHYCIQESIKDDNLINIDSVYLTASGGPFLGMAKNLYSKAKVANVVNHPNWKMGKKISVDSATMSNKILELIEAHILFLIPIKKLKIKIHKESLVHSSIVYKNGLVKMIMHDTSMRIPIRNSLFENNFYKQKKNLFKTSKNLCLNFNEENLFQFPILPTGYNVLKLGPSAWILFIVFNDYLVNKFLNNEIFFYQIVKNLVKIFKIKSVLNYCNKKVNNIKDIYNIIDDGEKIIKNYEIT